MLARVTKSLISSLLFFAVVVWQTTLNAEPSGERLCDKLYSDSLNKAKQALVEGKRDEAVRFLLEAATVTEQCARSTEPDRQRGREENILASAPFGDQTLSRVFR
jgi:hypothetical protein